MFHTAKGRTNSDPHCALYHHSTSNLVGSDPLTLTSSSKIEVRSCCMIGAMPMKSVASMSIRLPSGGHQEILLD